MQSHDLRAIATLSLWPVVIAPSLPEDWFDRMQELTSPPIAKIVQEARLASAQGSPQLQRFSRELADVPIRAAIGNLIEDLTDLTCPRRVDRVDC